MARIRTIKPEFPQSESVGKLSREARLLFIQLWTLVDDSGRTRASSRMLASLLYPYDSDVPGLIDGWLSELDKSEMIHQYTVDGNSYLEICNWLKHQKIDKPSISRLPPFVEGSRIVHESSRMLATDLVPSTSIYDLVPEPEPKPKKTPPAFVLPSWIPEELWKDFEEMRKKVKAPMTDRARNGIIAELEKLQGQGMSPVACLEQSIRNSHRDVWPLKQQNGNGLFNQPQPRRIVSQKVEDLHK
jgi:hypothetical protein